MKVVQAIRVPFFWLSTLFALSGCGAEETQFKQRLPAGGAASPEPMPAEEAAEEEKEEQADSGEQKDGDKPEEIGKSPVQSEDSSCKKVPASLRDLYYSHFENLADGKDLRYRSDLAAKMAKLLGMTLKESSGNPASVTDMKLRGSSNSVKVFFRENAKYGVGSSGHLKISLEGRNTLLNQSGVTMDKQTNFGLLQMSADRLYTQKNRDLYKTFKNVILNSPSKGAAYCGSSHVFRASSSAIQAALKEAASCSEGYSSTAGIKCFAKLVTICPALNIQLGLNAPAAYFATRKASPKCSAAFTFLAKSM